MICIELGDVSFRANALIFDFGSSVTEIIPLYNVDRRLYLLRDNSKTLKMAISQKWVISCIFHAHLVPKQCSAIGHYFLSYILIVCIVVSGCKI